MDNTNTDVIYTARLCAKTVEQKCLLCENTLEFQLGAFDTFYPWVCPECLESVEFIKFLMLYKSELVDLIMNKK
jgi:hypothetical protein